LADTIADAVTAPSAGLAPLVSEGITLQELETWRGTHSSQQAKELRVKYRESLDKAEADTVDPACAQRPAAEVLARLRRETRMSEWFDRATITAAAFKNACEARNCLDLYDLGLEVLLEGLEENERYMRALKARSQQLSQLNSQLLSALDSARASFDRSNIQKDRLMQRRDVDYHR
jgi:hypothetical protein